MRFRSAISVSALAVVALLAGMALTTLSPRTSVGQEVKGGAIYAQLSSVVTQKPEGSSALLVKMESNDAVNGIGHSDKEKTDTITVKTPGVYFIMAAAQVGREAGASDDHLDLWIRQNGKDVDNSNTRQAVKDAKFTSVLVCQGIAECKAGDTFNVVIAASAPDKSLGIVATTPKGEPAIPSIILSMYKIN